MLGSTAPNHMTSQRDRRHVCARTDRSNRYHMTSHAVHLMWHMNHTVSYGLQLSSRAVAVGSRAEAQEGAAGGADILAAGGVCGAGLVKPAWWVCDWVCTNPTCYGVMVSAYA